MQRTGKKISLMINENYLLYFLGGDIIHTISSLAGLVITITIIFMDGQLMSLMM